MLQKLALFVLMYLLNAKAPPSSLHPNSKEREKLCDSQTFFFPRVKLTHYLKALLNLKLD